MRLLPDIDMGSVKLSTQSPYTLNGRLIVYCLCDRDPYGFDKIYIKLDNEYTHCLYLDDVKGKYETLYNEYVGERFFDEHGYEQFVVSFHAYNSDLQRQCRKYDGYNMSHTSGNYNYTNGLNRLYNQNRAEAYDVSVITNNVAPISATAYTLSGRLDTIDPTISYSWTGTTSDSNGYTINRDYSGALSRGSITFDDNHSGVAYSVNSGVVTLEPARKYIHAYNYKPEYIKHYMPNEDGSSLLLGVEIEVAGNKNDLNKEEVVKKCIQIINRSEDDTEDLLYSTHDSTVQIELDTMPATFEFHKQMNYKEMFKYLDEIGYKGHDCDCAGLHVHANRSYLGKSELKQQLVISKILYILEKFNDDICVIARRNNSYSKFVGKAEVDKSLDVLYGKYKSGDKHVALNLKHDETIEFRCFKSTLKYETFILTLEFVKDIIDYAKRINIEEIEQIKWSDLMDTFSDELKEYYKDRLEKEKKKKEEKTDDKKWYLNTGAIWGNSVILPSDRVCVGFDSTISYVDESSSHYEDLDTLNELATYIGGYGYNMSSVTHSLSGLANSLEISNNNNNDSIIAKLEKKEKEIESLKKKIKYSNNFMEKAKLNRELSKAQKEFKKLKKEHMLQAAS